MVVVATTLVREARSKSVAGWTGKAPLLATDGGNGAPGSVLSYVKVPRAFKAIRLARWVMATEAAGKAWWVMAFCRMEKAPAKISSWSVVVSSSGEGFGVFILEVHDMAYAVLPYLSVLSHAVRVV
jgi:hypothetical protein